MIIILFKVFVCYLFLCLFIPLAAMGDQHFPMEKNRGSTIEPTAESAIEPKIEEKALGIVDGVHGSVSGQLIFISNYLDNFFSSERMDEESSRSKVVLSYLTGYDHYLGSSNEYVLRAQLHFPKTERRLRLVIDSSEDEVGASEAGEPVQPEQEGKINDLKAALQYIFVKSKYWQVSTNTGIRFSVPLDPFAKLRIRRLFFVDGLTLRLTQSVFWFTSDGWGETTSFDVERKLNDKYFFRSTSQVSAVRDTGAKTFSQSFSLFQDVGERKIMVYTLGMSADLNSPAIVTRYYVNAHFRHNFYKKWAFYELVPGISLDRGNSFNASPGFVIRFDIVFG